MDKFQSQFNNLTEFNKQSFDDKNFDNSNIPKIIENKSKFNFIKKKTNDTEGESFNKSNGYDLFSNLSKKESDHQIDKVINSKFSLFIGQHF